MEQNNYLQTLGHCFVCHGDFFGVHGTCTSTATPSCGRCFGATIEATLGPKEKFVQGTDEKKFCAYCGSKLEI